MLGLTPRRIGLGIQPISFVGALDMMEPLVAVVYSTRRVLSTYNGPLIRIRRDSDDQELDISPLMNGDLDEVTAANFVGGANSFVVRRYDQKSGFDISSAVLTQQPAYNASAQNGRPGVDPDSNNDEILTSTGAADGLFAGGGMMMLTHRHTVTTNARRYMVKNPAAPRWGFTIVGGGQNNRQFNRSFNTQNGAWTFGPGTTGAHILEIEYDEDDAMNDPVIRDNGSDITPTETLQPMGSAVSDSGTVITMAENANPALCWGDPMLEDVLFSSIPPSSLIGAYRRDLSSYWGITLS